jgi:hypothetical protein
MIYSIQCGLSKQDGEAAVPKWLMSGVERTTDATARTEQAWR